MVRLRTKSTYVELMQRLVEEYRAEGNSWPASAKSLARWAIDSKKWDRHGAALIELCARDFAKAMRQEYFTDPQGRRVRAKVAARFRKPTTDGIPEFETLWGDVRSEDRDFAEVGFSNRRSQIAGEVKQLHIDVTSFNENHNPGPPIQLKFDFTPDVEENQQPTEYKYGRVS